MKKLMKMIGLFAHAGAILGGGMGAAIYFDMIEVPEKLSPLAEKLEAFTEDSEKEPSTDASTGSPDAGDAGSAPDAK